MKRTVVFGLVRAAKKVRRSSLIPCDRYAQGCIKQSPGQLHGSLDVDDAKELSPSSSSAGNWVGLDMKRQLLARIYALACCVAAMASRLLRIFFRRLAANLPPVRGGIRSLAV